MGNGIGLVGVVGAGAMGTGIARNFGSAGFRVMVVEPEATSITAATESIRADSRLASLTGERTEDPSAVLARLQWTDRLDELAAADVVIECASERRELKRELFVMLGDLVAPDTMLASTTSAIPIDELAAEAGVPERVVGLHFMNPALSESAVEVVRGPRTSPDILASAIDLLRRIGKNAIVVDDRPGFVLSRILMQLIVQAAATVDEGAADPETVDAVFEQCLGHPMGPLRTADLIGLDTVLDTLAVLHESTGDDRYLPPVVLSELVRDDRLGRKTGQGFYDHA